MRIFLFLIIVLVQTFYAQSNPVELLKSVQDNFKKIKDLTVGITQTVNSENAMSGRLMFKQPDSYRLELANQIIITDGKTFWNYNKRQKKLIVDNFEKSNDNIFSINYLLFEVPAKSNLSSGSEGGFDKLVLKSKEASFPYDIIELWIDQNKLIKQVKATDNTGISYKIVFDKYSLNQNLKAETFSFKPTEEVKVIDLR
jgi:chaperone LolA